MRCWHKDLIPVLPRKQLVGQWRELCLIAKSISDKGTPNHILVNRVMDYPLSHLEGYARIVFDEMKKRGYKAEWSRFESQFPFAPYGFFSDWQKVPYDELFNGWHNDRYRTQCLVNLQEKYDCGGISEEEWNKIRWKFAADDFFGLSIRQQVLYQHDPCGIDWKQFAKLTCCDPFKSRKPQQS